MQQLRRERIAERIRALQELVPTVNKVGVSCLELERELNERKSFGIVYNKGFVCPLLQTDRAAMIDEIVDYVKFLRLQVKVYNQLFFFKCFCIPLQSKFHKVRDVKSVCREII